MAPSEKEDNYNGTDRAASGNWRLTACQALCWAFRIFSFNPNQDPRIAGIISINERNWDLKLSWSRMITQY